MPISSTHYPSYSFVLYLDQPNGQSMAVGGFSDAPGLPDVALAQGAPIDYRAGGVQDPHIQRLTGMNQFSDVTLNRGAVASPGFSNWAGSVRGPSAGAPSSGQPSRLPGLQKVSDVTLKRGVVDSSSLWNWINSVRGSASCSKINGTIVLRNRAGLPVQQWKLTNVAPVRYAGPALTGKSTDVAIEELVLSVQGIEIVPPHHR